MAAIRVKDDRHETRLKPRRNHRRENLKRQTTSLTRDERHKRLPLLLRGPLIDEEKRRTVPQVHGLRKAASRGSSQAVQAHIAVVALVDVPIHLFEGTRAEQGRPTDHAVYRKMQTRFCQ